MLVRIAQWLIGIHFSNPHCPVTEIVVVYCHGVIASPVYSPSTIETPRSEFVFLLAEDNTHEVRCSKNT